MNDHVGTSQSVSVIGLGDMGSSLARTLIEAGYQVSVWNRSRDKVDAIVSAGGIACSTPKEALLSNTHVLVCVADYSVWNRIIEDHSLQNEFKDRCLIQLTGGTFEEVVTHAAFIESHGGRLADGAIMCFPRQLGTSDASLLMSGVPAVLDECDDLLRTLAPDWTNLGDDVRLPSILSRSLVAGILTSFVGFLNGMAVCRAAGISLDVYKSHAIKANAIVPAEKNRLVDAVREGRTEETQASIDTWAGAHQTIHAVADAMGTNLVLQNAVKDVLKLGQDMGLGDHDLSALIKVFAPDQAC